MDDEILTNEEITDVDVNSLGENEQGEENSTADLDEQENEGVVEESATEQKIDVNAIAAAARRKAEEEKRQALAEIDNYYATTFGHLNNPITGEPIRSERDYRAALQAQEELKTKQELESKGIDPSIIDRAVAANPLIRQAQDVLALNQQQQMYAQINADIAELSKMDSSITSFENVPPQVIQLSMSKDISLVDSYKILNYGKISDSKQAAIQQSAINQAKGKAHLNPVNGVATPEEGVEIPSSEMSMWREMFPNKTKEELKKLYNETL